MIGYVYLADYYYAIENSIKEKEALDSAKKIAEKTKDNIDEAYVDFGFAKHYKALNINSLFIKLLNKCINVFDKKSNENFILALLYEQESNYTEENRIENLDNSGHIKANEYALKSKVPVLIS